METWQLNFEWLRIRHWVKDNFNKKELPDLNAILFLIGLQELGFLKKQYSKEEKQDLMHIAVCRLLSDDGYYEFEKRDEDQWPHWKLIQKPPFETQNEEELFFKEKIIKYFEPIIED